MATTTTTTTSCSTRTRGERHHTDRSFGSSSNTRQIVVLLENGSDDDDDDNNQSTTTSTSTSTTMVTCTLCDPHSGAPRPYVLRKSSADLLSGALVWELHALSVSSYASYFITQSTSSSSSSLSLSSVSVAPKDRVVGGRTGRPPRAPLLYVATRVDPLFFLLARHEPPPSRQDTATVTATNPTPSSSSQSSLLLPRRSWQPWDQIRREYQDSYSDSNHNNNSKNNDDQWSSSMSLAYQLVDEKQLQGHFYKRYHVNTNNDHDNNNNDDETFYQFCPTKALRWLTRKQDAVLAQWWRTVPPRPETKDHPLRQAVPATTISPGHAGSSHESTAITTTVTTTVTPSCDTSSAAPYEWAPHATTADRETAREESIQIVASYLNAAWRKCFYHHVNADACSSLVDHDNDNKEKDNRLLPSPSRQTSLAAAMTSTRDHLEYYTTGNMSLNMAMASQHARNSSSSSSNSRCRHGEPEAKKIKTSAAAKQLEKVNTKGMKKMSAFFTVKKK